MAAVGGEDDEDNEDNSVSMRIALFGIRKTFPKVKQLDTGTLEKFIQENEHKNLILLDVREQEEYDVSHLPHAIRVGPDEPVDQIMEKIKGSSENLADHHIKIVCYCCIGYRSSAMAQKLYPEFKLLKKMQKIHVTSELFNLEGSIFKWANEGKELVDCNNEKTQYCHPYNYVWGKLLESKLRVYEPASKI